MTNDRQPDVAPGPPAPRPPVDTDPHQLRQIPGEIIGTFARWIGFGALVGAVVLGVAGLWYFGPIGLMIGAALGAIIGGIAGLLLLFWVNWPF